MKKDKPSLKLAKPEANDKETVSSTLEQAEIAIQASMDTKGIPVVIKKLVISLIVFFATVVCLTLVETVLNFLSIKELGKWFDLAEYYGIRYVLMTYLTALPTTYNIYRRSNVGGLASFTARSITKIDRVYRFHITTRNDLEDLDLLYDYQLLTVTSKDQTFTVSFLYAMITVLSTLMS